MTENINDNYTSFYKKKEIKYLYPTEFVVRTFKASYPNLRTKIEEGKNQKVLDIGFGDGRNSVFLAKEGYLTYGIEITEEICEMARQRFKEQGLHAEFKVGRNNNIPYEDEYFDIVLACHSSYYLDGDDKFEHNLNEISRVIKQGGVFITSLPNDNSYIFKDAVRQNDGSFLIQNDYYNNRNGYRLQSFESAEEIEKRIQDYFTNFSFGHAYNDYYGIDEKVFWVVCEKRKD
ncbi:class I SAM-dependent methyltransferase [Sulfurimonas sp.]|uniref:class I SAM-dependent methyltransferase n=1 Tax=Sulfurimonas sp. TaxID=2022749 RepID=UPI0019FB9549|nr:class I SAM-dependent methyltransferase [Sulfurimonas sp.]MBE0515246.1 class I SAM-dependent methyltransferase [Sulfurimonas sp.]